jgi:hypothetical protein
MTQVAEEIAKRLRDLDLDERRRVMAELASEFCTECWGPAYEGGVYCQCWNDE